MRLLADCSIDAIVTDPPYGLEFMGKEWDGYGTNAAFGAWCETWLAECLRVLKPGGHILAFGGTRTWHRLACAAEDVGFGMRDSLAWLYGSGFPKSLNVGKAIDKQDAAGERLRRSFKFTGWVSGHMSAVQASRLTDSDMGHHYTTHPTQPCVATAEMFDKLRPALPAVPEWVEALVADRTVESENFKRRRKVGEKTSGIANKDEGPRYTVGAGKSVTVDITAPATAEAAQWEGFGTALKPAFEPIVMGRKPFRGTVAANVLEQGAGALNVGGCRIGGRFPANVILDEYTAAIVDEQSGQVSGVVDFVGLGNSASFRPGETGKTGSVIDTTNAVKDTGGASRFFYTAKANQAERPTADGTSHPTVKPISLMQWLIRLVTPPGGVVLEPFAGSGTTVEAAIKETVRCVAIERDATYLPLIRARIDRNNLSLFAGVDE
jgi:DNA modification methylase